MIKIVAHEREWRAEKNVLAYTPFRDEDCLTFTGGDIYYMAVNPFGDLLVATTAGYYRISPNWWQGEFLPIVEVLPDRDKPRPPRPELETVVGYQEAWRWWDSLDVWKADFWNITDPAHETEIALGSTAVRNNAWYWDKENRAEYRASWDTYQPTLHLAFRDWDHGGFYAFKSESVKRMGGAFFGRVALYGTVVEHANGFRGEKARVLDVWCANRDLYRKVSHRTQVRGVFHVELSKLELVNQENQNAWLTLETLKESEDSSRWNGRQFFLQNRDVMRLNRTWKNLSEQVLTHGQAPFQILSPPSPFPKLVPPYPVCWMCGDSILPEDRVSAELQGTDELYSMFDRTIKIRRGQDFQEGMRLAHAECVIEAMENKCDILGLIPLPAIPQIAQYLNQVAAWTNLATGAMAGAFALKSP